MAKKKPEPGTTPAVTCFDIAQNLQAITSKLIEQGGELLEGDMETLQQWQAALEDKAENIGHVLARIDAEEAYYKAVEEAAAQRRKAREATRKRLRGYLLQAMIAGGVKSIKKSDGLFSVTVIDGKPSAHVEDERKLPYDLVEIVEVLKPNKAEILKKLQAGETVPGASLEYGEPYLMVK